MAKTGQFLAGKSDEFVFRPAGENEEKKEEDDPPETEEAEEEVAPTEMTLDEWRAMQNSAGKKKQFNIRKAGEG